MVLLFKLSKITWYLIWDVDHVIEKSQFICSPSGKAVIVGHADGAIIKYNFEDEGQGDSNVSNCTSDVWGFIYISELYCLKGKLAC